MTTTTETPVPAAPLSARRVPRVRILGAFLIGIILVAVAAAGSVLAYEQVYAGKIVVGVSVGGVDVAGLTRGDAAARLEAAFAPVAVGTLTIDSAAGPVNLSYAELGRRLDTDAMLDQAFAIGRTGNPVQQVVDTARTATSRVDLPVRVSVDLAALRPRVAALAAAVDREPVSATLTLGKTGITQTPAAAGQTVDQAGLVATIGKALSALDAPSHLTISLAVEPIEPAVNDSAAALARTAATRMIAPVVLSDSGDTWTIPATTVQSWISFGTGTDGSFQPVVDVTAVQATVAELASKIDRKSVSASYLVGKGNHVVGVKASKTGRTLDPAGTASAIQAALLARAGGTLAGTTPISPSVAYTQPTLTTAQAAQSAPLMRAISSWTTYYIPGPHNGNAANITLPAMAINGTVVAPGQWFSFWKTVGDVTFAKGYKLGGAIINGHSVEGASIGGGICSCSTTIFNAAVRAGLQMGERKNHFYYIARYPKGLDATVFKDGGSVQDMTFRNDTKYPILIRAYARPGVVRFTLYSVPTGRKVTFSKPTVKNYIHGYTVVKYTTSLRPGRIQQVEYQADGQDVWVTRTVTDASGKVIHRDTFYSHYARMVGMILKGQKKAAASSPAPSPAPASPTP